MVCSSSWMYCFVSGRRDAFEYWPERISSAFSVFASIPISDLRGSTRKGVFCDWRKRVWFSCMHAFSIERLSATSFRVPLCEEYNLITGFPFCLFLSGPNCANTRRVASWFFNFRRADSFWMLSFSATACARSSKNEVRHLVAFFFLAWYALRDCWRFSHASFRDTFSASPMWSFFMSRLIFVRFVRTCLFRLRIIVHSSIVSRRFCSFGDHGCPPALILRSFFSIFFRIFFCAS